MPETPLSLAVGDCKLKHLSLLRDVLVFLAVLVFTGPAIQLTSKSGVQARDWRTAPRDLADLSPLPETYAPAIVQALCARTWGWRGALANHCWIAAKAKDASQYRRFEVIGWRLRRSGSAVVIWDTTDPDRHWYGAAPTLHQDIRGARAEAIIAQLPAAVDTYPYAETYRVWPGPNSNTFIAHLGREIPDLQLALPGNAIGKDYLGPAIAAAAPSGTGFQVSLGGLFGVLLAQREGLEVNILGLVVGINPLEPSLTVPGVGRVPERH